MKKELFAEILYPERKRTEEGFICFCSQLQLTEEEKRNKGVLESLKKIYDHASTTACVDGYFGKKIIVSREPEINSKTNSKIKVRFFETYNNGKNYNERNMNRICSTSELFIDNNDKIIFKQKDIFARAAEGEKISYELDQKTEIINQKGEVTDRVRAGTYLNESKTYGGDNSRMPYFSNVENNGILAFNNLDNDLSIFSADMKIGYSPKYSTIYLENENKDVKAGWGYSEKRNPDGVTATVTNYFYDESGKLIQLAIDPKVKIEYNHIEDMYICNKIINNRSTIEDIITEQNQKHGRK